VQIRPKHGTATGEDWRTGSRSASVAVLAGFLMHGPRPPSALRWEGRQSAGACRLGDGCGQRHGLAVANDCGSRRMLRGGAAPV